MITIIAFKTKKAEEKMPETTEKLAAVSVSAVQQDDIVDVTVVPGLLEAWSDVTVSTETSGRIVSIAGEKGQSVAKGDKLLGLDNRTQIQNVHGAELALADATRDFEKIKGLKKTGAVSDSEREKAEVRRDLADVRFKEAKVFLSRCDLMAPIDGTIQDRFVSEGEYVAQGVPAFRIVDDKRLKVIISVPERDVFGARVGKQLQFTMSSVPGRTFTGTIIFVAPAAEIGSNSFRVELEVANDDRALKPGMIASVEYVRGILRNVVNVPLSCLIPSKGEYIAYEVADGAALRRVVRLSTIVGDRAVIESGLAAGAPVVVEGHRYLEDGMRVEVAEPSSSGTGTK